MAPTNTTRSITDQQTPVLSKTRSVARMTRHRHVMVMLLKGHTVKDIALEMGYKPASISILIRTKAFQLELNKLRDVVLNHVEDDLSKLGRLSPLAHGFYGQVLADQTNTFSSDLKFKVSKDLFDRLGIQSEDIQTKQGAHLGDIAELVSTAFEKAKVIEVHEAKVIGEEEEEQVSGEQITAELRELLAIADGDGDDEDSDSKVEEPSVVEDDEALKEIAKIT